MWKMYFYATSSWEGAGSGVLFVAPNYEYFILLSYIL
jgi:hypothetical protein